MSFVATLTLPSAVVLNFLVAKIDQGWPVDQIANVSEPLRSPGVDGERIRVRRREYRSFMMQTYLDLATYALAVAETQKYRQAISQPCTLVWAAADYSGTWNKVLIEDCDARAMIGELTGAGSTPGGKAIATGLWRITCQAVAGGTP